MGKIDTMYYPGFPTDLQSQMSALGAVADGISIITENIFETRFKQIPEFRKMGAIVDIKGRTAIFEGVPKLYGAEVKAEWGITCAYGAFCQWNYCGSRYKTYR